MLPEGLCYEIDSMIGTFWWGQNEDKSKIHWVNWDKLCKPKSMCGLVFRSLIAFNKAMLAKQGWCILKSPDSLMDRITSIPHLLWMLGWGVTPVILGIVYGALGMCF